MSYKDAFYAVLLAFIRARGEAQAVRVTGFREETYEHGGCETCSWTEIVVEISYVDTEDDPCVYKHSGTFVDLVRELTEEPEEDED